MLDYKQMLACVCMCVCVYIHMLVCVCVCARARVYTYTVMALRSRTSWAAETRFPVATSSWSVEVKETY